jgi:ABC-type transport system involved in Fe-S cluster assembly fused permease/ATPase subunit
MLLFRRKPVQIAGNQRALVCVDGCIKPHASHLTAARLCDVNTGGLSVDDSAVRRRFRRRVRRTVSRKHQRTVHRTVRWTGQRTRRLTL